MLLFFDIIEIGDNMFTVNIRKLALENGFKYEDLNNQLKKWLAETYYFTPLLEKLIDDCRDELLETGPYFEKETTFETGASFNDNGNLTDGSNYQIKIGIGDDDSWDKWIYIRDDVAHLELTAISEIIRSFFHEYYHLLQIEGMRYSKLDTEENLMISRERLLKNNLLGYYMDNYDGMLMELTAEEYSIKKIIDYLIKKQNYPKELADQLVLREINRMRNKGVSFYNQTFTSVEQILEYLNSRKNNVKRRLYVSNLKEIGLTDPDLLDLLTPEIANEVNSMSVPSAQDKFLTDIVVAYNKELLQEYPLLLDEFELEPRK